MHATVKRLRHKTVRRLVTAGAAVVLAGVATGPAHAGAGPAPAAQQQSVPGALAARSTHVTLVNLTGRVWPFEQASLRHGIWSSRLPEFIGPSAAGEWASESNGVMTGTEGQATYATGDGPVEVRWNNPYVGSNTYDCRVPSGYACRRSGGSGDNASVVFEVRSA
ncbi:hypothetical protein ACFXA3_35375 [Streptomyces sp. NPDC059456]|uniref:hypothetical protein n=1 Tax=Streptomyces sp. NPDC059456 TaxID=3346838 RepID=UPI0036AB7629